MVSRIAPKLLGYIPCQVSFSLDPHMHEQICLNQALTRYSKFLHCPTGSGHALDMPWTCPGHCLDIVLDEPRGARDPTMEFFHENLQPCSQSFGNLPAQISCFLDTHRVFYEFLLFKLGKSRTNRNQAGLPRNFLGGFLGTYTSFGTPHARANFAEFMHLSLD